MLSTQKVVASTANNALGENVEIRIFSKPTEQAADLNGDSKISPADAIEALYLYFESGQGKAPQRNLEMREPQ